MAAGQLALGANKEVSAIAPFVYPQNKAKAPKQQTYMPDGLSYLAASDDKTRIIKYSTTDDNEIEVVFNAEKTRESSIKNFEGFSLSPDGTKMLIYRNSTPIYRRSFEAEYYVFDIKRNTLKTLSPNFKKQRSPIFSPDARTVAFVSENNIYMKRLDFDSEVQVTKDGKANEIINGVPDWTYEEEFAVDCSMVFSPDSQTFCFLKYNEKDVPSYSFSLYEGSCNPMPQYADYPGMFTYKYPVAGKKNSTVSLHSFDVLNKRTKDIEIGNMPIEYIPRICFTPNDDQLLVFTLNRDQNRMEIFTVNPKSTIAKSLVVEQSKAWIAHEAYVKAVVTDRSLLILSPRTGYTHIYEYSFAGSLLRTVTSGDYDITDCYGADAKGNIYFQSTRSGVLNRVVSKIDTKGKITDLSPTDKFSSARFTKTKNFYVIQSSSATQPPLFELYNDLDKKIRTLEDNSSLASFAAGLPQVEFTTFPSDGYQLNAYIIKPDNFNPSQKYPVIMWQYSGPGSQEVLNKWSLDWQQYAAKQGFVVVCVDGRGTGHRGFDFETIVYKNLGYYETIDQINAAKAVAALSYVDSGRIGISGWSYGGYETLMAISDMASPFAAGVAIAPVTDWRYYDTVYAERYMLTPQANESGYDLSAPVNRTKNVRCPLLIMSGTADDNVHLSNTMEFVSRLQSDNTLCDMLLFPNMNHSINGCDSRALVYAKMIDFFKKNL